LDKLPPPPGPAFLCVRPPDRRVVFDRNCAGNSAFPPWPNLFPSAQMLAPFSVRAARQHFLHSPPLPHDPLQCYCVLGLVSSDVARFPLFRFFFFFFFLRSPRPPRRLTNWIMGRVLRFCEGKQPFGVFLFKCQRRLLWRPFPFSSVPRSMAVSFTKMPLFLRVVHSFDVNFVCWGKLPHAAFSPGDLSTFSPMSPPLTLVSLNRPPSTTGFHAVRPRGLLIPVPYKTFPPISFPPLLVQYGRRFSGVPCSFYFLCASTGLAGFQVRTPPKRFSFCTLFGFSILPWLCFFLCPRVWPGSLLSQLRTVSEAVRTHRKLFLMLRLCLRFCRTGWRRKSFRPFLLPGLEGERLQSFPLREARSW